MMKYIKKPLILLVIFALLLSLVGFSVSAEGSCGWFIKKNKNERPGFPANADEIRKYGAYFIDDKCSTEEGEKKLYLTFDAGYENGNLEKILDVLKEENVPAAFFILDNLIIKNTDLVCRMAEEGHLVCNHTKNHKDLSSASEEEIARNLTALEKIYEEKTGREMSKYFRFPEGKYSIESMKILHKLGYKTIFWSFAYDDWDNARQPSPTKALGKVLDNTHNGAVILFHPNSDTNAKIMPTLIAEWRKMGYSFGTLDELTAE